MGYEFSEEIRAFLQEKRYLQNISPKTITLYESCFKAFNGATDSIEDVKERIVVLRTRNVSPVTVNTYLRHIKCFYKWKGKDWKIPWLKEEQKILQTFSPEHIKKFLSYTPSRKLGERRIHALVCLLLDTGLRISEGLSLTKEDIDFDNLVLRVLGKGNKHRLVPVSSELRKILWRYMQRPTPKFVFGTKNNTQITVRNFLRDFKKLGKKLHVTGVRVSPHTLRHTFAVNYLKRGGNLEFLRRILGHSSILTTQKYLRSLGVEDLQAVHSGLSLLTR
jgi:integrase/recombinase XerD